MRPSHGRVRARVRHGAHGPRVPIYPARVSEIVVMKFGGTSVADGQRIKRAAQRIVDRREGERGWWRCCPPGGRQPTS